MRAGLDRAPFSLQCSLLATCRRKTQRTHSCCPSWSCPAQGCMQTPGLQLPSSLGRMWKDCSPSFLRTRARMRQPWGELMPCTVKLSGSLAMKQSLRQEAAVATWNTHTAFLRSLVLPPPLPMGSQLQVSRRQERMVQVCEPLPPMWMGVSDPWFQDDSSPAIVVI